MCWRASAVCDFCGPVGTNTIERLKPDICRFLRVTMFCVRTACKIEEEVKKSRFIGIIAPCHSEQEVAQLLKAMHKDHPNSTHIAFAYRIKSPQGFVYRFHDAGEPSGTAGKPIFQHLEGKNLINLVVVVIRYYGGIKLGAGGLTRAYGNAAKAVIEAAAIEPFIERVTLNLRVDYQQLPALEYLLKKLDGEISSQEFAEQVKLSVNLPKQHEATLRQSFPANY